jgi:2-polyprenyl-3-methyl-5-hydroxy-6-metoxy-1,4-benzoquinol methylase
MVNHMPNAYKRLRERYESGAVPWDEALPPPEVMAVASALPPGRALDLGCGYGRASIYLAGLGWQVDGVDFIEQAIDVARRRAREAGVAVHFHLAPVTDLAFLTGPYDLVLDVGCLHALEDDDMVVYSAELRRLLAPGGRYLLFARLRAENEEREEGPRGLVEAVLYAALGPQFSLERVDYGATAVAEKPPWPSAWFYFRKE